MSVLVVGPVPPHRAGRPARAGRPRPATPSPSCSTTCVASDHAAEAVVLSTCNRVEVYADVDKFHGGVAATSELLARHAGVPPRRAHPAPLRALRGPGRRAPVLGRLRPGLDGRRREPDPRPGPVGAAHRAGRRHAPAAPLDELAQQALRVGKRAHTETGIDRAGRSLVTAGLERGRARSSARSPAAHVLVVGAGSMSALAASVAAPARAPAESSSPTAPSRTRERLAAAVGGSAVAARPSSPAAAGRAPTSSSPAPAPSATCSSADAAAPRAVARRDGRPLVVLDLALPARRRPGRRTTLPGVTVVDLETPRRRCSPTTEHAADVEATRAIVADEVAAFLGWQRAASVAPTVVALRGMADDVVAAELVRLGRPAARPRHRAPRRDRARPCAGSSTSCCTRPTVRVKELAEEPGGQSYADALRKLFGLDPRGRRGRHPRPTSTPAPPTSGRDAMTRRCGSAPARSALATAQARAGRRRPHRAHRPRGRAGRRSRRTATPRREALAQIGGTGVFVSALRDALLAGDGRLRRALAQGPADRRRRRASCSPPCRRARTRATCWSPATG